MSLATFGLTAAIEQADMFPQWGAFDANSSPNATTIGNFINEEAADLAALLYAENVSAAAIELLTGGVAYTWCCKTLKLMVARRIFAVTTQSDPELRKSYLADLKARLDLLEEKGATALGDSALDTGTSSADGPHSHATVFGLERDVAANMSSTVPRLRMDDQQ